MCRPWYRNTQQMAIAVLLIGVALCCLSCKAGQLFKAQEWSQNYTQLEGATCTSYEMIDGNINTVGESGREILITLPERKSIHRIVLRGINFEDFIVYQGRVGDGNWQKLESVSNNTVTEREIRVTATTERLRFRIGGTFDDERAASKIDTFTGRVTPQRKRAAKRAAEIELYGFKEAAVAEAPLESPSEELTGEEEPLPDVDIDDEPLF